MLNRSLKAACFLLLVLFLLFSISLIDKSVNAASNSFSKNDRYLIAENDVEIYDNRNGSLEIVGYIKKGQIVPREEASRSWHSIQFSNFTAFVKKEHTKPYRGVTLPDDNQGQYITEERSFTAINSLIVYEKSTGNLNPLGVINKGQEYKILHDYGGEWLYVSFANRTGFVKSSEIKKNFLRTDRYFNTIKENVPVYDNRSGKLETVGYLKKGQRYPREHASQSWHTIQFNDFKGYVKTADTEPVNVKSLTDENYGEYDFEGYHITANNDYDIYERTSEGLVPIATIKAGQPYDIILDYGGDWLYASFANRTGFIRTSDVEKDFDRYFEALRENVPVYDNRSGSLEIVGYLSKGQEYPRFDASPSWHSIQFNDFKGFVKKEHTKPSNGSSISDENFGKYDLEGYHVIANADYDIYQRSSQGLTLMATIKAGQPYDIIQDYGGDWLYVSFANRTGFLRSSDVEKEFNSYFKILKDGVPVYDNRGGSLDVVGYLAKDQEYPRYEASPSWHYIQFDNFKGYVKKEHTVPSDGKSIGNINDGSYENTDKSFNVIQPINVYEQTSNGLQKFATLKEGNSYSIARDYGGAWIYIIFADRIGFVRTSDIEINNGIIYSNYNITFDRAVEIQMNNGDPKYDGQGLIPADEANVRYYLNPSNFEVGNKEFYQFMILDKPLNISNELINNHILKGKRNLSGQAGAFKQAAITHQVNELYLIAHALHETGHGKSKLAEGVKINGKTVYNMYGIGAYDGCAINCGAQTAYENEWFSPSEAIIGGAKFISERYIKKGQNTLYKMKWDPDTMNENKYGRQYATHIMWPVIQARFIHDTLGDNVNNIPVKFDVPSYKEQPPRDAGKPPAPNNSGNNGGSIEINYPEDTIAKTTVNLTLREGPSTNYSSVKVIEEGSRIMVIGENDNKWLKVETIDGDYEGWVSRVNRSDVSVLYVEFENLFEVDSDDGLTYRDSPAGSKIGALPDNTLIAAQLDSNNNLITQQANLGGTNYTWLKVTIDNESAWIADNFITKIK